MTEEKEVREWIKEKLEEGVEEERIGKVLSEKGYEPSLVDEVRNTPERTKTNQNHQNNGNTDGKTAKSKEIGAELRSAHKSRIGSIFQDIKRFPRPGWKSVLVIMVVLVAVLGTGLIYSYDVQMPDIRSDNTADDQDTEITGEEIRIVISDSRAKPSRPALSDKDSVLFVNNASHDFELSFSGDLEGFVLEEGGKQKLDIDSVVYYTAEPVGTRGENVKGSITTK